MARETLALVVSVVVGAFSAGGCDANPTAEPDETRSRAAPVAGPDELTPSPPSRGRVLGGQTVSRIVAWPDSRTRDTTAYEGLNAAARRNIDDAPVPVLVPGDPELLASAVVTTGTHWAAVATAAAGQHVSIQISRQAKVYPHIKAAQGTHEVRGHAAFVTHNEGVWVASWIENGVAYNIELECADLKGAACQDSAAVVALAETLRFVGGRGGEVQQ